MLKNGERERMAKVIQLGIPKLQVPVLSSQAAKSANSLIDTIKRPTFVQCEHEVSPYRKRFLM